MARKKKNSDGDDSNDAKAPLKGFDIRINEFGEIISSLPVDQLNQFLNEEVEDKKLKNQRPKNTDEAED